jgi:DedD protein
LSGPKPNIATAPSLPAAAPEPVRNVTVDLTTSKAPETADNEPATPQTASSAASSAEASAANSAGAETAAAPSPAPSGAAASAPAPTSTGGPGKSSAKPAAARPALVESAVHSPTSAGHGGSWSVQLGSFASRANADNLTRQVKGQGFSAFVLTGGSGTAVRYRVRVGPLADRESAERMAAKLKSVGHVGSVVSPTA